MTDIDFTELEDRILGNLVLDVEEAIQNAAENGYPVDHLSDEELADELWLMAGFATDYDLEILIIAVKAARMPEPNPKEDHMSKYHVEITEIDKTVYAAEVEAVSIDDARNQVEDMVVNGFLDPVRSGFDERQFLIRAGDT